MRFLHYNTKNEEGKFVVMKFWCSENEIEKLTSVLTSRARPSQIEFRGNILKTSNIEIIDEDTQERPDKKFDVFNATTQQLRDFVSDFEYDFKAWQDAQPLDRKHVTYYLIDRGAYDENREILNREKWRWINEKNNAYRMLLDRRKYAKKKELEELERLAPAPTVQLAEDEIKISDIPF